MISILKSWFRPRKRWQDEIQELHRDLVPLNGEAETLQGELVRVIQNLADECHRNGWMNWDEVNEEEISILTKFLPDPTVFSEAQMVEIRAKLKEIEYCGKKGADEGNLGYEEVKYVAEKVVIWCRSRKKLILKTADETWLDYEA